MIQSILTGWTDCANDDLDAAYRIPYTLVMEDVMTYTVCIANRFEAPRQVRSFTDLDQARKAARRLKCQFGFNTYMIFSDFMSPKSRHVWNSITGTADA